MSLYLAQSEALPSRHLLVQIQQWKQWKNVLNMFKLKKTPERCH